jgi:hypothetical protein
MDVYSSRLNFHRRTVVGFFVWLWKRRQENFENAVLKMFMREMEGPYRNVDGIRASFYFDLFQGAPADTSSRPLIFLAAPSTAWPGKS